MRFFFRSRKFKIMVGIVSIIVALSIVFTIIGGIASPVSSIIGAVVNPAQKFVNNIGTSVQDFFNKLNNADKIALENASLNEKINNLNSDLIDYDKTKQENEFYKKYLGIKDENPDFQFEPSSVISKNASDPYKSFLIDAGSLKGISKYDPVITSEGLVGYVSEVYSSYSKVTTILDPSLTCGSFDRRTKDIGVVTGNAEDAKSGNTRIKNLSRTSSVAVGDMIVTSGGGVFPEGLLIGTLKSLHREEYNSAVYGIIDTAVNFDKISNVMVLTYFNGQGNILKTGE